MSFKQVKYREPAELRGFDNLKPFTDTKTLDSLLKANKSSEEKINSKRTHLSVDDLIPGINQPRTFFDPVKLSELAENIKQNGIIQPLIVRKKDDKYEIIAGERRWRAARIANLKEIPVDIRDVPDRTAAVFAIIENVQREDLDLIDQAAALEKLQNEYSLTQEQITESVSYSRSKVASLLNLLDFPEEIKQLLRQKKLSLGHAKALFGLESNDLILYARKIVDGGLSVRKAEEITRNAKNTDKKKDHFKQNFEKEIAIWNKCLSDKLSSTAKVTLNEKGEGRVVIHLNTIDEIRYFVNHIRLEKSEQVSKELKNKVIET